MSTESAWTGRLRSCGIRLRIVGAVRAAGHLDDAHADVEKWSKRANSYLHLAKSYLSGMEA